MSYGFSITLLDVTSKYLVKTSENFFRNRLVTDSPIILDISCDHVKSSDRLVNSRAV